jgi:hypothetical protein
LNNISLRGGIKTEKQGRLAEFHFFILSLNYYRSAATPLKTIGSKKMKEKIGGKKT